MKTYSRFTMLMLFFAALLVTYPATAQSNNEAKAGFKKIKTLVGTWQGTKPSGDNVEITYELMSGGSAVVETLRPENEPSMVTVYHLDGDRLMMTHYCSAGNQPRMVADVSESGQIQFSFLDVTNRKSNSDGYMSALKFSFTSRNRLTQEWVFTQDGKDMASLFEFRRKG